jgi:hypothetical protein
MRTSAAQLLALATAVAGLLSASPGAAQQPETLLGQDFESGGFGGPMVQVMDTGDDMAVFVGGRGGSTSKGSPTTSSAGPPGW